MVYIGGDFTTMGRKPRRAVAAVDGQTGKALTWSALVHGLVCALAVTLVQRGSSSGMVVLIEESCLVSQLLGLDDEGLGN